MHNIFYARYHIFLNLNKGFGECIGDTLTHARFGTVPSESLETTNLDCYAPRVATS